MPVAVDADLRVEESGSQRNLRANDFATTATGAATQATLAAVLAAVDGLEVTLTDVDLNTDQIEAQLTSIFTELLAKLEAGDITGLATSARQDTLAGKIPDEEGTWDYEAGVSGTVNVPASMRVLGIAATGGSSAASMTIDGGASVPVPANMGIEIAPRGNLVAPVLIFTSTVSYFVEYVG